MGETSTTIEAFRSAPVFSGLDPEDLAALAGTARPRTLRKGEILFDEGDEARGFYLLAEGRVKVFKTNTEGREQVLHFISPGETFAEAALYSGSTYPAGARALEPGRAIFLPRESLFQLVEKNPRLALNLIAGFAKWVRRFNALLAEYSKAVPARLAGYLLAEALRQQPAALADGAAVRLPVGRAEIAAHLGTVGETLSRAFGRLRDGGLIEVADREVILLDLAGLRDVATGGR